MGNVSENRYFKKALTKNAGQSRMAIIPSASGGKRGRNRLSDDGEVVRKHRKIRSIARAAAGNLARLRTQETLSASGKKRSRKK